MDNQEELLHSPPGSPGRISNSSSRLTPKQYILVNLSKFVVEIVGTCGIAIAYSLIGDRQEGVLLILWVLTLFAQAISGAHFNPAVTIACMLRKNSNFGSRRLLGIMYIVAQFLGGLAGAILILFLEGQRQLVTPMVSAISDKGEFDYNWFPALISETIGAFFFVFMFMLCTDVKTQFSSDKVINCFIISSAYISARLLGGGSNVTVESGNEVIPTGNGEEITILTPGQASGPLLNPAVAFGQMVMMFNFQFIIEYLLAPFGGAGMALVFYELVFVKTQEYLAEDDGSDGDKEDEEMPGPMKQSTVVSERVTPQDEEETSD